MADTTNLLWNVSVIVEGEVIDVYRDRGVPHFREVRIARDENGTLVNIRYLVLGGNWIALNPQTSISTIARATNPPNTDTTAEKSWGAVHILSGGKYNPDASVKLRGTPSRFDVIKYSYGPTEVRIETSVGDATEHIYVLAVGQDSFVLDFLPLDFGPEAQK